MIRIAAVSLTALLAGCFSYAAVPPERPSPGTELRVELNERGQERLRSLTGRGRIHVEGTLVRRESDTFVLSSPLPLGGARLPNRALEERLQIPTEDMASVQVKELDRVRSGMLVIVAVGATIAAVTRIFEDDPGGVVEPPGPPGPGEGMAGLRGWLRLRLGG